MQDGGGFVIFFYIIYQSVYPEGQGYSSNEEYESVTKDVFTYKKKQVQLYNVICVSRSMGE